MFEVEGGAREDAAWREEVMEIWEVLRRSRRYRDWGTGRQWVDCSGLLKVLRHTGFAISIIDRVAKI
jgi:hypothetical protein